MVNAKRSLKKPFPETVGGTKISSLMAKAQHTKVGKMTMRWIELERELSRLHERRAEFAAPRGDKVMERMIEVRIADAQKLADKLAVEISELSSRNATDVICKLAVARRMQCGCLEAPNPDTMLATSALNDMLRFVEFKARKAAT